MIKARKGRIIPNGVSLEKHEYETVLFLTSAGYTIELIRPSHVPGVRTPDIIMEKVKWEMKSPKGKSKTTIEHAFQLAAKQSENIIFDLRRTSLPLNKSLAILAKLMKTSKRANRLLVITKRHELLKYPFDNNDLI